MPSRRFPPPWTAEVTLNCFIVRDADGQQLAYVYYESEPGRPSAAKLLSKDAARGLPRILLNCRNYCGRRNLVLADAGRNLKTGIGDDTTSFVGGLRPGNRGLFQSCSSAGYER